MVFSNVALFVLSVKACRSVSQPFEDSDAKRTCRINEFYVVFFWFLLNVYVFPLYASQDGFHKVKAALDEYKSLNGTAPSDEDFFSLVLDPGYDLSDVDQFGLWNELIKMQSPPISKDNLRSLVIAKRNSVGDFFCEFSVMRENNETKNDPEIGVTRYKCAFKDNLFFVERHRNGDHNIISFSGDAFIKVWFHPSLQANILPPPQNLRDGFVPTAPLFQAMIADANLFHTDRQGFDIVRWLDQNDDIGIFEKKEVVEGREYLILSNFSRRILLDVDKDFSVYRLSSYSFQLGHYGRSTRVISRTKMSVRTLFDLTDYGNGIWIPQKSETLQFFEATEGIGASTIVTYDKVQLNQGLETDFFVDVIPEDALVTDSIRNMVYVFSDRASINGLLRDTVRSKRSFVFQYISVTLGIILIITWTILQYRAYLQRKNASE